MTKSTIFRHRLLYVALLVIVVVVCALVLLRSRLHPVQQTARMSLGTYHLGEEIRSKVELNLKLRMNRGSEQELDLRGELGRTPVDIHDGVVEVAYELSTVQVKLKGASPALSIELLQAEKELSDGLSRRFYVRHRPDGAVIAVSFERGYHPSYANILLSLVGDAQYVTGATEQNNWTSVERDANGEYLAAYARTGPSLVSKRKLNYLPTNSPTKQTASAVSKSVTPRVQVEQGAFEISLNEKSRVKEIRGVERLKVELGGTGLAFDTELNLHLSASRAIQAESQVGEYQRRKGDYILQPIEAVSADPRVRRSYEDRMSLKGATFDRVWDELQALAHPQDSRERSDVLRKLEALCRLHESSIGEVLRRLPNVPEQNGKIAIDALSLAQTDAAQDGLSSIALRSQLPNLYREYAIRYLSHQEKPNGASLLALSTLIDEKDVHLRQMARFTYGTLASKVSETQPEQAETMVKALLGRLNPAMNESERGDLYLALGNSANALALPTLREAARAGRSLMRSTAIEALGRINEPTVVSLLLELLKAPEDSIRMACINGIQRREIGPFLPALVDMAKHDPSAHVRSSVIELLGSQLRAVPQLQQVLVQCSQQDPDMKVKQAAARILTAENSQTL